MKKKIFHATKKGQITLPAEWRRQFNTDYFALHPKGNLLEVSPVYSDEEDVIFNAEKDNEGKGVPLDDFVQALQKSLHK
jgi:hypothetical protein